MKSSTITLAMAFALSSSSSVSGMPHYLGSVPDASLPVRAPIDWNKRSLLDDQSNYAPNTLFKRETEQTIGKSSYPPKKDESEDIGDEDDNYDCNELSDADDEAENPAGHYFKADSNATSDRALSSSSVQSTSYKLPVQHSPVLDEKSPNDGKSDRSKEWHKPSANTPKVEKHFSQQGVSSSQSFKHSSHVHYSGSGSEGGYHGKATFFSQDGNPGACGKTHRDSDYIVAIQSEMYGGGQFCGKTVVVTRKSTGQSIRCVAADACPGCPSNQSLDLSIAAFNALGSPEEGIFDIFWQVME